MLSFKLSDDFVDTYRATTVPWGFQDAAGNSVGELVFLRTYSRKKEDGTKETWVDVCRRVVEGTMSIQKDHAKANRLPWSDNKAARTAEEMFARMFCFKWTPPGRGLWMMGTPLVNEHRNSAALQNCAFVSTGSMTKTDPAAPFAFLMEASMLGIGVGFDTEGAKKGFQVYQPSGVPVFYGIPDTREGWVESVVHLLESYLKPGKFPVDFDYSEIRPAGAPIKTFGGTAAGPEPLQRLHSKLREILDNLAGKTLDSTAILDVANLIGVCVVSGNVRRSAELALGKIDDEDFLNAKNYGQEVEERYTVQVFRDPITGEVVRDDDGSIEDLQAGRVVLGEETRTRTVYVPGPAADRAEWGWMSNNSVAVNMGDDLSRVVEGIQRNGEPGIVWMDLSRSHGRLIDPPNHKDRRSAGYNPCAEQTLESFECCVSGDTLIQTELGTIPISSVVGNEVNVWNGERWAPVKPFFTGRNSLHRVTLSDGSYLDATPGHEWSVRRATERTFKRTRTDELEVGMVLPEFSLGAVDGKPNEHAYAWGWVAGDGYIDNGRVLALVQDRDRAAIEWLGGRSYPWQLNHSGNTEFCRVNVSDIVPLEAARILRQDDELPAEVFGWDAASIAEFVGGWIDTDGSVTRNPNTDHYVLYGSERKLRQAQMLLRRIGVDHSTLRRFAEAGQETNYGARNIDIYRLLIPSYEAAAIATRLKRAERIGDRHAANNAHPTGALIDRARKQKIVSIEKVAADADTYCFNEPEKGMGVFGNVLTYQCTLVETYLNRHDSLEDYKRTLKFAFMYAKTVTLLPTHWSRTNAIMQRNRRIGTSMSGIANFADRRGLAELRRWMDEGYSTVQHYDETYSEWLCVRESIKTTTVKPSGTVSILAGESPGAHWAPGGEYFDRRVRYSKDDPVVILFRWAGYNVEPAFENPDTTVVVTFPIHSLARRSEKDVTIFEKANLAAMAQRHWSDNSVSVTLSFDPEDEGDHIETVLAMHEGQLKTVSFLPMATGTYRQMPYEAITRDAYEAATLRLMKVDLTPIYAGEALDAVGEAFCSTDACEVKTLTNA